MSALLNSSKFNTFRFNEASTLEPQELSGITISASEIHLNWEGAGDTYQIFRGIVSGQLVKIAENITLTSYADTGLQPNTRYLYYVRSENDLVLSDPSNEINIYTATAPPTNLSGAVESTKVTLSWTIPSGGATTYYIKRRTGNNPFVTIGTSNTNSYVDTNLTNQITYYYKVSSTNSTGIESVDSSIISVTPEGSEVTPPGRIIDIDINPGVCPVDTWEVLKDDVIIATNSEPDGWLVTYFDDELHVKVPDNTPPGNYVARHRAQQEE